MIQENHRKAKDDKYNTDDTYAENSSLFKQAHLDHPPESVNDKITDTT